MSEPSREILQRYLSGRAGPDECEQVEGWLGENPARWAQLSALGMTIAEGELSKSSIDEASREVWARLERVIGQTDTGVSRQARRAPRQGHAFTLARPWSSRAQLAATILLALVAGTTLGFLVLRTRSSQPPAAVRLASTRNGERAVFRLPDGTRVMLGVASSLRFPQVFPNGAREVSLQGEAYFDVVHDPRRPFAVRAGNLIAQDLGTQFTVRAYPEDAGARVVVREGRVAIRAAASDSARERIVAPGQLGRLSGSETKVELADTAVYFAWTEGRLVLDRVALRDALPQLSRWFDLDFRLADTSLGDVPLSATLRTRPTTDVLDGLAASLGMRQHRKGRTVTLYPSRSIP